MNEAEQVSTMSGPVYGPVLQARTITTDTIVLHTRKARCRVGLLIIMGALE